MIDHHETHEGTPLPSLTERLAGIAAFLPIFEAPDFSFGEWRTEQGQMPWFDFSSDASRFLSAASQLGRLNPGNFNWVSWKQTDEARRLFDDPHALRDATVADLAHLLTTHMRQDRFVEGHLTSAFKSGHLTEIVRRAKALLREVNA